MMSLYCLESANIIISFLCTWLRQSSFRIYSPKMNFQLRGDACALKWQENHLQNWLFARQSLNIVNCGFCSNRIPLYFPLCVCLCTGVTSQLFSIIWWLRAWKPYIFLKHINQDDHPDHSYHLITWPLDHLTTWTTLTLLYSILHW